MKLNRLFEAGRIGKMHLKNRLVMAPMGVEGCDAEGFVKDELVNYYAKKARGGVGLIISQSSQATRFGRAPGRVAVWDDKFIPGLARVAEAVHRNDGKMAWQILYHGKLLLRWLDQIPNPEETRVLGPSAIPWVKTGTAPKEATIEDIRSLIDEWSEAARRVRDAGFDAVEIHGAHGYSVTQWLSPRDNRRTDGYGGSQKKRARFACELISRIRQKVGHDFPILFRFSASDYMPGGITIEQSVTQAPLFVEAGADALDVSASESESTQWQFLNYLFPDGAIVNLAEAIKKTVNVPVITVGKIWDPLFAEQILETGKADFIAMGRAILADPELPNKAKDGHVDDIRHCIYCGNCQNRTPEHAFSGTSNQAYSKILWPSCTVNPALHREDEFVIKPAAKPKKVMVVGGGLSGMEAARVLAERGHNVALYEKSSQLGGQFYIAAQQKYKRGYLSYLEYQFNGLKKASVQTFLNTEMTIEKVNQNNPDVIVMATGAYPITPDIPGSKKKNAVQAIDVITGKAAIGNKVLVVGGRLIAMEVALDLAEQGKKVILATRHLLGGSGTPVETNLFRELRNRIFNIGVQIFENSPVVEIRDDGAYILFHNEHVFLYADTVIMAVGFESNSSLFQELSRSGRHMLAIGDCVRPRDALIAIREGAEVGREIE
jgi:2,4-dienoyl-CoA reductase-like NADH-dependent reductase (Old Yellow Enzyme family)/thioredoxin reductase